MKTKEYVILSLAFGLATGFSFGMFLMEIGMRNQAISAKVAEYQIDKTTGEVTFVWLTPKNP